MVTIPRPLLEVTGCGLYCAAGDFYVDPWQPVDRAVITHGHADHARPGSRSYLTSEAGRHVLRQRLGDEAVIEGIGFGKPVVIGAARVSLHPAGHMLGSAQVRVERRGEVWVVSGDYKTDPDRTCEPLEVVRCHTFITESTFGLPVYRWPDQRDVLRQIESWWSDNRGAGRASVLFVYALGKAQRVLGGLATGSEPVLAHGAVLAATEAYRQAGVGLPRMGRVEDGISRERLARALVLVPPSAQGTPWMRRLRDPATGFASGWMRIRGARSRRAVDRGFVLSDHADWNGLLETIEATGATRVGVTHGSAAALVRWLSERGLEAWPLATRFDGKLEDA
jgi:putative mRNA 3-end processing factor